MASEQYLNQPATSQNEAGPAHSPGAEQRALEVAAPGEIYRRPRLVLLGKAVDLVRNDASGHLRDSSPNGWWVRNS